MASFAINGLAAITFAALTGIFQLAGEIRIAVADKLACGITCQRRGDEFGGGFLDNKTAQKGNNG